MLTGLIANPLIFLIFFAGLILAIAVHEASHAFVADKLGDPTAKQLGRLTLNPLAHLDPLGTVMLLLFRFGWGKPIPVNPHNFKSPARDNFLVALAGPSSNLATALILSLIGRLVGVPIVILEILILVNILLAVFNLLPIPPLDGSKVLGIFLGQEAYLELERFGPFILLAVLFASAAGVIPIFDWLSWIINALFTLLTGSSAM